MQVTASNPSSDGHSWDRKQLRGGNSGAVGNSNPRFQQLTKFSTPFLRFGSMSGLPFPAPRGLRRRCKDQRKKPSNQDPQIRQGSRRYGSSQHQHDPEWLNPDAQQQHGDSTLSIHQ
ncbi:hypothetical protein Nepgr_033872 [Nepenthes gracilis]|uniref:Uncharacterized protein n=1 Tax=Nepenthes gracilis TaxID=150966 RepID=A0AAD3TLF3_NEPGR|nr:hypothetical protein Nepgr_033872 [Nepenthes gracilis]